MLTGKRPFNDIKGELTVILEVAINGKKPDRPHPEFPDALWNLLLKAWDPEHQSEPSERPSIQQVMNQLKEDANDWDRFVILHTSKQGEPEESRASLVQLKRRCPLIHSHCNRAIGQLRVGRERW